MEPADDAIRAADRYDATYRLLVFEGAQATATAFDLVDVTLEDALDAAARMSGADERLWSLALVDEDGYRLTWLSGMDYRERPGTAVEWRRRARMQDRYLSRRSLLGLPLVLPDGLRVIRLFPEWVHGLPLWESFADPYHLTEADLDLSPVLTAALIAWNDAWGDRSEEEPPPAAWASHGRELWRRLQAELEGTAEVRPDFLL